MKRLLYVCLILIVIFEVARNYFIMPFPGSQEMNSVDFAYSLHSWRWIFRFVLLAGIVYPLLRNFNAFRKWLLFPAILLSGAAVYAMNFVMSAEIIFRQPETITMADAAENKIPFEHLVIGAEISGEAKAYPIEIIAYHHQVRDQIGGKEVMVTYCSVCRTGRIFVPEVNGEPEEFRLVGMDHFNAMFEDSRTGSWWRQASGAAVAGDLKGAILADIPCIQVTVRKWFELFPKGTVMQVDPEFANSYDHSGKYENGEISGGLTGTDKKSWEPKSWVIGIECGYFSKAYDWNALLNEKVINDNVGPTPIVIALSEDQQSFAVFERPYGQTATLRNDSLSFATGTFDFAGSGKTGELKPVRAGQEFWHSWLEFHPKTEKYP